MRSIEMISMKSPREIEAMRKAGRLTAQARALAGSMVRPGVTTKSILRCAALSRAMAPSLPSLVTEDFPVPPAFRSTM